MNSTSCIFYPWAWGENMQPTNLRVMPNSRPIFQHGLVYVSNGQGCFGAPYFSGQAVSCPLKIPMSGKKGRAAVGGILMFHKVHKLQPDSKVLKNRLTAKGIQYSILQSEWRWSENLCLERQTLSCPLHSQTWRKKYKRSLCCRNCQPSFPWGKYFFICQPSFLITKWCLFL